MSDPLKSPESIIQDFSHNVEDLQTFILTSKKRSLSDSQRKIILKSRISEIKTCYNDLTRHPDMDLEARSEALFDSIPKLTDTLNSMDFSNFELIYFEINALINSFASALITLHSVGDLWSMQGSATLLVQIIIGLPKIDHLPAQLQGSLNDPEYLDRWKATFNCLQFSAETYTGVISSIKTIGFSDFIYWVNQSYFYLNLVDYYFSIFEFENIAKVLKTNPNYFFRLTYILCSSFQNLIEHSHELLIILGTKWPVEINTAGLFEDRSLSGYLQLLKHVKENNKTALTKLDDIFKTGIWTMNDNPKQSDYVKAIININRLYDYYGAYIESLKVIEPEFNKLFSNSKNRTLIKGLIKAIELNDWTLSYYEKMVGSRDNIFNSPFANSYTDKIGQQLEIVSLLVICTGNIDHLENSLKKFEWLFSNEKITQFKSLIIRKFLVELFIATKLIKKDYVEKLYSELPTIQELLVNLPRDFTSFIILENIIGFLLGRKNDLSKDEILIKINKNGLIVGGDIHLYNEFQEYVEYVIQTLKGENFLFSEQLLNRKSYFNIIDPITWLIPDFNVIFKNKLPSPLYYLPFNRRCDGIVNNIK